MADPRNYNRFTRAMLGLEGRFGRLVGPEYNRLRLRLSDHFAQASNIDPGLPVAIQAEMAILRSTVSQAARDLRGSLDETAVTMARAEVGRVAAVRPDVPGPEAIDLLTAEDRRVILDRFVATAAGWVGVTETEMLAELSRLQVAGTPLTIIIARLFAPTIIDRASTWRNGKNRFAVEAQRDLWTTATGIVNRYYEAGESLSGQKWRKQAIAAIDERTTDTCLRVHGQIKDLDDPFKLIGTPRFADEIQNPPFHNFCRTATTLWVEESETFGVTTKEMRDAARSEIRVREETGTRVEIHPASATSRRRRVI